MNEKIMQDLLRTFPDELIEEGLKYYSREITLGNRRLDLAFIDRRNRLLLVEVQKGSLDTRHIDRHIDFVEGFLEKNPDSDVRLMYIANRIDHLRKTFLERRGYEYKEIPEHNFLNLAEKHELTINDQDKNSNFNKPTATSTNVSRKHELQANLVSIGDEPSVTDKIASVFGKKQDKIISTGGIKEMVLKAFPGTNSGSIIPSDYCYNMINADSHSFTTHLFEFIKRGQYRCLGKNYPYTGDIFWLGEKVGFWESGTFKLSKDPRRTS